jgi:hypothetical protein
MSYDATINTISYSYQLNDGAIVDLYSGGGNGPGGTLGDVFSGFHDVQLFKWGELPSDQTLASIDYWELSIPEPTTAALLGMGSLTLLMLRRRR